MANGLYTNEELVDSLAADLNNMLKDQFSGQYISACSIASRMFQKLVNLKAGIQKDLQAKDEKIETLKEHIKTLGGDVLDNLPVDILDKKDGAKNE